MEKNSGVADSPLNTPMCTPCSTSHQQATRTFGRPWACLQSTLLKTPIIITWVNLGHIHGLGLGYSHGCFTQATMYCLFFRLVSSPCTATHDHHDHPAQSKLYSFAETCETGLGLFIAVGVHCTERLNCKITLGIPTPTPHPSQLLGLRP